MAPQDLTDEVWDYLLLQGPLPSASRIPRQVLERAAREFAYWYPFDLRVSPYPELFYGWHSCARLDAGQSEAETCFFQSRNIAVVCSM